MTQEEKNKIILDNWNKESLANGWVNEHIKNNQLKEQVEYLQFKIDKAIEIIDLITPELWNISNKMTYRLKDVKNILKEDK